MENRLSNEMIGSSSSSSDEDILAETRVSALQRQFESGVGETIKRDAIERWRQEKQGAAHRRAGGEGERDCGAEEADGRRAPRTDRAAAGDRRGEGFVPSRLRGCSPQAV